MWGRRGGHLPSYPSFACCSLNVGWFFMESSGLLQSITHSIVKLYAVFLYFCFGQWCCNSWPCYWCFFLLYGASSLCRMVFSSSMADGMRLLDSMMASLLFTRDDTNFFNWCLFWCIICGYLFVMTWIECFTHPYVWKFTAPYLKCKLLSFNVFFMLKCSYCFISFSLRGC